MKKHTDLNKYGDELEKMLLLRSSPIAVKMLKKESELPEGAIRPKRDLGYQLGQCQGFAMSRRQKKVIAMLKEDHRCWVPVIGLGLAEAPQYYLEGRLRYPGGAPSLKVSRKQAQALPRLEYGKYAGVVSAPLKTAEFIPDVVVIYSNPAQLRHLLLGMQYKEGYTVTSRLDPSSACVQSVVPVLLTGECQVTIPCGGDFTRALAREDEIIFSVPTQKLEDLMLGLRHAEERGATYLTTTQEMRPDFPRPNFYFTISQMLGMDVDD